MRGRWLQVDTTITMDDIYFFITLFFGIGIPLLLHKKLKRKIKNVTALTITEVFIGLTISFIGLMLPFYFFFSGIEYPTVIKNINNEYYFEQTEYGMAWTESGKHLDFYKKRKYWFDKKVGHIQWLWVTSDLDAKIKNSSKNYNRLILTEHNKVVLDTILTIENKFDFKYQPKD